MNDSWTKKFGKYKESFFSQSLKLWSDSAVLKWADRYFYNLFFPNLSTSIYSKCLPKIKLWAGFLSWKKRYLRDWWKDLLFFPETWFRTLPFVPWPPWWKGLFLHTIPCTYGANFINIAPFLFLHAKTRKHITTTSWSKANSVWKGLKKAFQQHMVSWIEAVKRRLIGRTGH